MQPQECNFRADAECPVHGGFFYNISMQSIPNIVGNDILREGFAELPCPACGRVCKALPLILNFEYGVFVNAIPLQEFEGGWVINFTHINANSQLYGSDNEHMRGTLYFRMFRLEDMAQTEGIAASCAIYQDAGDSFSFDILPLNVENPEAIKRLINYGEFRDAGERYYRHLIGPQGIVLGFGPDATTVRIVGASDSGVAHPAQFVIHAATSSGGW